jgi:branched-subunit amino acid ABC-type transport system permease component
MVGEILFNIVGYVAILCMLAIGLQLVSGLLGIINLAHGELVLIGVYAVYTVTLFGGSVWLGLLMAPLAAGLVALLFERGLIRYLYQRPIDCLMMTWAVSILIRQLIQLVFGAVPHSVSAPLQGSLDVLGLPFPLWRLLIIAVGIATLVAVQLGLTRTSFGLQLRAAVANRDLALSMGIDVDRLFALTFAAAGMLAGLAGFLLAPVTSINPQLGISYLLPAFFVMILGGLGSIPGLILGAAIIGGLQTILALAINPVMGQLLVLAFAFFFLRLRSREAGLVVP